MKIVITFGTFDLLHIGHINLLHNAKKLGDKLIVGVSSDKLNYTKKFEYPTYNQHDRLNIIKAIRVVDNVFFEDSLEKKRQYILENNADILVMGDDWKGKFDDLNDIVNVIYIPRTPNISSSNTKYRIYNINK